MIADPRFIDLDHLTHRPLVTHRLLLQCMKKPSILKVRKIPDVIGSSVSVVARQYDVNANQVFSWRKRYRDAPPVPSDPSAFRLMPVVITAEQDGVVAPPSTVAEKIETDVAGKYRICVGSGFNRQALRRVLDVLERR
jgi:transposase